MNAGVSTMAFVLPRSEPYSPGSGAIAEVVRHQTRRLLALGHDVRVVAPAGDVEAYAVGAVTTVRWSRGRRPGDLRGLADAVRSRLHDLPGRDHPAYCRVVVRALRESEGAVVVVVENDASLAASLAAARLDVVLRLHNLPEFDETDRVRRLPDEVAILVVSDMVRSWTMQHCAISPDRIVTVPNGVDLDAFVPARDGLPEPGPLRVVCHGRIDPNKGIDVAADAVSRLRGEGVDVRLTVIGEVRTFGRSVTEVEAYVARLDRSLEAAGAERVGWVPADDVPALLGNQDVACVLSRSAEPFGLAALEAMAAGCAVVVSDSGALPEVVGTGGTVVPVGDVAATADALRGYAAGRDTLARARRSARLRAEQLSWSASVDALTDALARRSSG